MELTMYIRTVYCDDASVMSALKIRTMSELHAALDEWANGVALLHEE